MLHNLLFFISGTLFGFGSCDLIITWVQKQHISYDALILYLVSFVMLFA